MARAKSRKTIKQAKKIFLATLVATAVLAGLLLYFGGSGFRWFGKEGEHIGDVIKEKSEDLGRKADDAREDMKDAARDAKKDLVDKVKGRD